MQPNTIRYIHEITFKTGYSEHILEGGQIKCRTYTVGYGVASIVENYRKNHLYYLVVFNNGFMEKIFYPVHVQYRLKAKPLKDEN